LHLRKITKEITCNVLITSSNCVTVFEGSSSLSFKENTKGHFYFFPDIVIRLLATNLATQSLQRPLRERYVLHFAEEAPYDAVHLPAVDVVLPQLLDQILRVAINVLVRRPMSLTS
jgi:hypothetical protein